MVALLCAMAVVVASYYLWPAASSLLTAFGAWIHRGGFLRVGLAAAVAGGILSELTLVYVQDKGRWNARHLENMAFRFVLFFFNGMVVALFYQYQAAWFGDGTSWKIILPKVLVDQFIYTVFWSTSYQTLLFRWQALRFSGGKLWRELDGNFITERMLPVLVTNWMFWIPGVILVYSLPLQLQMPLNILATAMWSLLLASIARPELAPTAMDGPGLGLDSGKNVAAK